MAETDVEQVWSRETVPKMMKIISTRLRLPQPYLISLLIVSSSVHHTLISSPSLWMVLIYSMSHCMYASSLKWVSRTGKPILVPFPSLHANLTATLETFDSTKGRYITILLDQILIAINDEIIFIHHYYQCCQR